MKFWLFLISKFASFLPLSPRGILVFFSNVLSVWEAQETNTKSSSQRNNTHKSFSNCSGNSPKKYTVIHKTLITAAISRRFKFVSVRRHFVICDFKLYRSFALREIFIKPLVYVAVESV